mmetsp:Transcript_103792/g.201151  ORF Transcript_103792/g.201151 Transcript_103792/m.201151 type:complete len:85 (-) Transcript_103792:11-265(-)
MQNALRGLRGEQSPERTPSPIPKRRKPSARSRGEAVVGAKAGRKKQKAAPAAAMEAEGTAATSSHRHGWQLRPCEVRINLDLDD